MVAELAVVAFVAESALAALGTWASEPSAILLPLSVSSFTSRFLIVPSAMFLLVICLLAFSANAVPPTEAANAQHAITMAALGRPILILIVVLLPGVVPVRWMREPKASPVAGATPDRNDRITHVG